MPSLIMSFVHTLPPPVAACLNTFPADLGGGQLTLTGTLIPSIKSLKPIEQETKKLSCLGQGALQVPLGITRITNHFQRETVCRGLNI